MDAWTVELKTNFQTDLSLMVLARTETVILNVCLKEHSLPLPCYIFVYIYLCIVYMSLYIYVNINLSSILKFFSYYLCVLSFNKYFSFLFLFMSENKA